MKVYVAAPYSMKDRIIAFAAKLNEIGVEVTSSWLKEIHAPTIQMHELTHEEHQGYALNDIKDVVAGQALIFFTDPTKTIVRAGRHVEFGMAVFRNQYMEPTPIFVVGMEYENIFHHLPNVFHIGTEGDMLALLRLIKASDNTFANWMHNQNLIVDNTQQS